MIPSKDSIEELVFKDKGMSKSQNVIITFLLITLNCCMALFVPDIGSAITLVGSTINPIIGFILPVVLYWPFIVK
jgi:amino acid permease